MNIAIIGLGSMGRRRIRLLKQYIEKNHAACEERWKLIGVDSNEERCSEVNALFDICVYSNLEKALKEEILDCAIISSSPLSHAGLIELCLKRNLHIFTELNLVSEGYDKNIALAKDRDKVLFLSSTFMYRKEIEFIKKKALEKKFAGSYQYHIGQYLPEWHPWEKYQDFFIGNKITNACREIFAIELPWLTDTFGKIRTVTSLHKKSSDLDIEYDDMYHVLIEHDTGVLGTLIVDVVTPKAVRELAIFGEKFYIEWNGTPDTLQYYNNKNYETVYFYENVGHVQGYAEFVVENAYYDELVNFINTVKGKENPRYSFSQDKEVLAWIDRIEGK